MAGMLDALYPTSGFTSENSLSATPRTPPYRAVKMKTNKRSRLERSDSPASLTGSLHPLETISPAGNKPAKKRIATDNIKVEELTEDDAGYSGDIDVVYPEDTESADESDNDRRSAPDTASDDGDDEMDGLTHRLSKTGCTDPRDTFAEARSSERRRRRRETNPHHTKRSHSQSTQNEPEPIDIDALGDHDIASSARRQRRRINPTDQERPRSTPDEFVYFTLSERGSPANIRQSTEAMDIDDGS